MSQASTRGADAALLRRTIEEWKGDAPTDQPLRLLVLRRARTGRPVRPYSLEAHDLDTIVQRIVRDSNAEAQCLQPDPFRADLEGYCGEGAAEPAYTLGIVVRWDVDGGGEDEQAYGGWAYDDRRGPVAVMQRHAARALERADKKDERVFDLMKTILDQSGALLGAASEREQKLASRINELEGRMIDTWTALQEATDRAELRKVETRKADATIAIWNDVAGTIKTFGPIVANRAVFGGEKVLPEAISHPVVGLAQRLFDELRPEQLDVLQMALHDNPRALAIIAEIVQTGIDAKDLKSARAQIAAKFEAAAAAAKAAEDAKAKDAKDAAE